MYVTVLALLEYLQGKRWHLYFVLTSVLTRHELSSGLAISESCMPRVWYIQWNRLNLIKIEF